MALKKNKSAINFCFVSSLVLTAWNHIAGVSLKPLLWDVEKWKWNHSVSQNGNFTAQKISQNTTWKYFNKSFCSTASNRWSVLWAEASIDNTWGKQSASISISKPV